MMHYCQLFIWDLLEYDDLTCKKGDLNQQMIIWLARNQRAKICMQNRAICSFYSLEVMCVFLFNEILSWYSLVSNDKL